MELNTGEYLKKVLVDTQERVRDLMIHSNSVDDENLSKFLKQCALTQAEQAQQLRLYIGNIDR